MHKLYALAVVFFCIIIIMATGNGCAIDEKTAADTDIEGIWLGVLSVPSGPELRVAFEIIKEPDGKISATMSSIDQGAMEIPVDKVTFKKGVLNLEVNNIGGVYEGKYDSKGPKITGTWTQGGGYLPLLLERVEKMPQSHRPQEPAKPYPYQEEEVSFENREAQIKLAGTLTYPLSGGPFPAALLISGSGSQDRDETVFGHRPFLVLADHLTRSGIAVLRVDDRGVGKSTGKFADATTEDFAGDAAAGVEYLKTRKEIDHGRIGLIGHSEGGMIAPMLASRTNDVAFIVMMAGLGIRFDKVYRTQLINLALNGKEDKEMEESRRALYDRLFKVVEEKDNDKAASQIRRIYRELNDNQKKILKLSDTELEATIRKLLTPWIRYALAFDPEPFLKKVQCPVLAINGEKDTQVFSKENLPGIEKALKAGGNRNYSVRELPGLNHLFQSCETGSGFEYRKIEETISPIALTSISGWILEQTRKKSVEGQ